MLYFKFLFRLLATFGCLLFGFGQFCSSQAGPVIQFHRGDEAPFVTRAEAGQARSSQRFLGWKYAAMTKQDTSRWIRTRPSQVVPQANVVAERGARPALSSVGSASSFAAASFAAVAKLPTGYIPTAIVQGDFNADGKMDLAISNGGDDTIYVYLGNGDGTFAVPEVLYTQGQAPVWLAAAQLRTGGPMDLITVDGDSGALEVFFGNGNGTFQPSTIIANLSQIPTFVLAGDFNKDGHVDLAIGLVVAAGATQPQFVVFLGDGTGAFPSAITPPSITSSSGAIPTDWMAIGDLNNDGYLDVVTTVAFSGAVSYINDGGLGFQVGSTFNPIDTAIAVGLGDMNGDGCLDAIQTGGWGFLSIAKGNCDGTFTQNGATGEVGDVAFAVDTADVNGDGKLDVVTSSAFSDAEVVPGTGAYGGYLVSVLEGDGSGNLAPPAVYRVGSDAYSFAVSDLSGTGRPDIVAISETESTSSLLVNDGSGGFGHTSGEGIGYLSGVTNAPVPSGKPQTVDVNGDGKPDVVLVEFGQNSTLPSLITVLLNDGTGKLGAPIRTPITVGSNTPYPLFVAGNFRSPSVADLVYMSQQDGTSLAFFPGKGDGTFGPPASLPGPPDPTAVASGDFNRDGKLDFAIFGSVSNLTSELDVYLGNGDGTFNHLPPLNFQASTTQYPSQLIAGDFNHDGKLDLLVDYGGNELDLMPGNGDGTFQASVELMSNFGSVSVGDFNHDGYPDLIQPENPGSITDGAITAAGGPFSEAAFTVYLSGPGASFTKGQSYSVPGVLAAYPLIGDFNGDGNLDVALPTRPSTIGRPWETSLQIFQGNGDGTFTANGIPYQLPAYDQPVVGGDYRGLGVTDLLDLVGSTSSINTISATVAPALALTPNPSQLTGSEGSGTVTLALPATSSETVTLSASDVAVTIPGSVTFNAGQTQQSFTFSIGSGFDSTHLLAVTANLAGQSAVGYFAKPSPNVRPGVVALIGASTSGTSSVSTAPGGSLPLLLTLESVSGYSGVFGQFQCSNLPANVQCTFANSSAQLLPGGFAQVAFELTTTSATPVGSYNISVGASNGEMSPTVSLGLGVGGFSLNTNQSLVQTNLPSTAPNMDITASYTNGFSQPVQLSCSGLPPGASCSISGVLFPNVISTVSIDVSPDVPAQDYPFVITGTSGGVTSTLNATLRVSTLGASITPASASVKTGQAATFNLQLQSLNHFSNSNIQITCQSSANVTCNTPNQYNSVGDGATTTLALSVTPQKTSGAVHEPTRPWKQRIPVVLACLVALLVPSARRRRQVWTYFGFLVFVCIITSISACGSSGGGTGGSGAGGGTNPTPQAVTVVVSAQAQTYGGEYQVNAGTITLTVN